MNDASREHASRTKTWIWRFDSPLESIWPVLSDTARFNEAAALPRHRIIETPRDDGSVEYLARARIGPFRLEWEEKPVNWADRQWFEHCRVFRNGPLAYLCATLRMFPEPGGEQNFDWHTGAFPQVIADGDELTLGKACADGMIALENTSNRSLTLIVEENAWVRDALTAKRVTAMQAFRDLFDDDVLRPGDDVEIDHIAIMFTDLKGSMSLYERIGDPKAYALVREESAEFKGFPEPVRFLRIGAEALAERRRQAR